MSVAATAETHRLTGYREYSQCLPDYITRLASQARNRRDQTLAALTTPGAIAERQIWARTTFQKLIGEFPARTDLNLQVVGSFERPGYRVDRLRYESRPQFPISADFYLPTKGRGPYPGVLFQMGHAPNGKAYDSYQRACQAMAQLGYAVLAFDPIGQGERVYYPDQSGNATRLPSADDEHTVPGKQLLLIGRTCSELQLWDAIRSLDVLANHEQVDSSRLASAGQSGGATLTMMLAAVDPRLAAAAIMSGNTENFACPRFQSPGSVDDAEQNLVGSGPLGFDRFDLLYPFAPKPLLIAISEKDFFGTYSPNYVFDSKLEFDRLTKVYAQLGSKGNLQWSTTPLPHGLSYDSRLVLYNWLNKHLLNGREPIEKEPPVQPEEDRTLWATATGSTVADWHSVTPLGLIQQAVKDRAPAAHRPLQEHLYLDRFPSASLQLIGKAQSAGNVVITAAEIQSAPEVFLPAWLFENTGADRTKRPMVLLLDAHGRNAGWREGGLCQSLAASGFTVLSADLRGVGDLAPAFGPGNPAYTVDHQSEDTYAWASLILGKPMVGQRVADILALYQAAVAWLHTKENGADRKIVLAASGKLTTPALIAASIEPRLKALYLSGGLASFASLLTAEEPTEPFANWIPNSIDAEDLPSVVERLAPRRTLWAGPARENGTALDVAAARRLFGSSVDKGHLQLVPKAEWSSEALASFFQLSG